MYRWSLGLFAAFLVAALFGFGGIAKGPSGMAPMLYGLFIGVFVISVVWAFGPTHHHRMGPPHPPAA
jgi:uncharacterized membrane protein YtjA (UPF0391 family)